MSYKEAELNDLWHTNKIGDTYTMDCQKGWKIAYYPIIEDNKEPFALIERPAKFKIGTDKNGKDVYKDGIDFREIPLRYLKREYGT